jgi:alpha-L-rhamnosidase
VRKHLRNLLVAVLTVGLTAALAGNPVNQVPGNDASAVTVSNLRCEYLTDPLGLDVEKPRLSWIIESPRRGERQTAYRILVASTPELLARHQGDLWDSGKVASDQSVQLEYAGKALESPMCCHWKVRVWDKEGKASAWSRPARWTMGLLKPDDWQAKWIALPAADGLPHPWLRRTFNLESEVSEAVLHVNTPNLYELYLNGTKVSDDVLMPASSHHKKRFFANTHEVTALLKPGTNCIALWMAPGNCQPKFGSPHLAPIVRVQLELRGANGNSIVVTDQRWRIRPSCITQIGSWDWNDFGGERWDAAAYLEGWNQADFDDHEWAMAAEVEAPAVETSWQPLPGSRVGHPISPAKIERHEDKWVMDFGTNLVGWMRLRLADLKPGQQIRIDYADLTPASAALMHLKNKDGFQTFNQTDIYLAGDRRQDVFCSKFNQHGFRYAVVAGLSRAPVFADAEALPVRTEMESAGAFRCSNELFNHIHEATVNTFLTQTPWGVLGGGEPREKQGYGDGGSFLTGHLYNLRSDALFRKWLKDWCDNQRPDGFLNNTAPAQRPHGGGPSWGGQASELARRLHLYYGDQRAVVESYAVLKRYVAFLETHTKDDILRYFNPFKPGKFEQFQFLGDWTPPGPSADKHGFVFETDEQREFFNNCYRILLWEQLAEFAAVAGDPGGANLCHERLAVLRPLIHKTYYDPARTTYKANRQAYLAIALLARIMPPELRPVIFKQLEDDIVVGKQGHLDTGLQGTFLLLDLLTKENRSDLVARVMSQTTFPGWGFLLKERQVTTWPETWSGWGSQIILVLGSPGAWFYEGLAGVRPDPAAPGFKRIIIKPAIIGDLTWVKCHYDSPYGRIVSNWKREGSKLTMDVTIPPNTTATVYVPAKDADGVAESGTPAMEAKGVKFLRMENNAAVLAVESGTYRFVSKLGENR